MEAILKYRYAMMVIPALAAATALFVLPVSYDEAWTFLNFTQKGVAYSASHYPAPNNHILHSILTVGMDVLPGLKHLWKIRLSSWIVYVLGLIATFQIVRRHFGSETAVLVSAVAPVLFMTFYYSYMSRGYGLAYLLFLLCFDRAWSISAGNNSWKQWLWLSVWGALGCYTLPSFLYALVTLHVFLLVSHPKNIVRQALWSVTTVVLVAGLYLPLLQTEGLKSITSNRFVEPIGLSQTLRELPGFLVHLVEELSGFSRWILLPFLALSGWHLIRSRNRRLMLFAGCVLMVPILMLVLQRTIPFPRTFHYLAFPMTLFLVVPLAPLVRRMRPAVVLGTACALQVGLLLHFALTIGAYEDRDMALNTTASTIIPSIEGDKRYFFVGTLLPTNLEFELIDDGYQHYHIEYGYTEDAAKVSGFDYVIIQKEQDHSVVKPLWSTPYYAVYKGTTSSP
ncbi:MULTISPECIES: glycosyltransferase family 39 protein [unclassified Flavobacterium]|uniref:glycosyltransferase family 39 protein n=1 Tax=unclassified Flavobacterium TaxID=196869 RepID=UPI001F1300AD|nr:MULTISPECIES: glycosyltransferase family 39 protein [unclassified Flavobacterium]UMY65536.1 glycosyltransferase family 39 protein [Flavobacterium sp. HJ-32-4]